MITSALVFGLSFAVQFMIGFPSLNLNKSMIIFKRKSKKLEYSKTDEIRQSKHRSIDNANLHT